jgi:hypothetical protein
VRAVSTHTEHPPPRTDVFVTAVSILTPMLGSVAPFTLSRLLLRARVYDRETMTLTELERALPKVEEGLAEVLNPADRARVSAQLRRLLGGVQ